MLMLSATYGELQQVIEGLIGSPVVQPPICVLRAEHGSYL